MDDPRRRLRGEAALVYGDFDGQFTVEIHHMGFFCGTDTSKTYMDYEVEWFDYCQTDTWSLLWINDFLLQLGYDKEASNIDVYWCEPGKRISDGLKLLTCDADMVLIISATLEHKNLLVIVDNGPPKVISPKM